MCSPSPQKVRITSNSSARGPGGRGGPGSSRFRTRTALLWPIHNAIHACLVRALAESEIMHLAARGASSQSPPDLRSTFPARPRHCTLALISFDAIVEPTDYGRCVACTLLARSHLASRPLTLFWSSLLHGYAVTSASRLPSSSCCMSTEGSKRACHEVFCVCNLNVW